MNSTEAEEDEGDPDCEGSEVSLQESQPATSIASAYRLLTPSVKYAMEVFLSESSVITAYHFRWSTRSVAIFLACLGLTVFPVNVIVGEYISNLFEERCKSVTPFSGHVLQTSLWNIQWWTAID